MCVKFGYKCKCEIFNDSKGFGDIKVDRTAYISNEKLIDEDGNELGYKYKYLEEIKFRKESDKDNKIICIGFNPAKAEAEIDLTNKRLIKLLWEDYSGYTLINMYPEITGNKYQLNEEDEVNITFITKLIEALDGEYKNYKILLFFGRTAMLKEEFNNWIKENKERIEITIHGDLFTHPGSNGDIKKKKINVDNFIFESKYYIK